MNTDSYIWGNCAKFWLKKHVLRFDLQVVESEIFQLVPTYGENGWKCGQKSVTFWPLFPIGNVGYHKGMFDWRVIYWAYYLGETNTGVVVFAILRRGFIFFHFCEKKKHFFYARSTFTFKILNQKLISRTRSCFFDVFKAFSTT